MNDLQILLVLPLVTFVLCVYLGFAPSYWFLPSELRPFRAVVMPLVGCSLLLVVIAPLTMFTTLKPFPIAVLLSLALAPVNIWTMWHMWRTWSEQRNRSGELLTMTFCYALALITLALALLPPLTWNVSAPIGSNWDAADFYVPLGRALQLRSQRDFATLPQNPLVQVFTQPPVSGRVHAFSYLHATISSLMGIEPLQSFVPMMAFVLALQPLATYPLGRVLGLGRIWVLLATGLVALAWLPLWVAYNNFSSHLLALPLLPLALASGLVALQTTTRSALVTAAFFAAALATAYFPALTAYVALLAPAALVLVWRAPKRATVIIRGLALAILAMLLSIGAQVAFFFREGYLGEILRSGTGFQVAEFVGLPDLLGIQATFNRESFVNDPRLTALATGIAVLLAVVAIIARQPSLLIAMVGGAVVYQLFTGLRAYHYGFYKGITFQLPIYMLLLVAGAAVLWQQTRRWTLLRWPAAALVGGAVALLLWLNAITIWSMQSRYADAGPQLWTAAQLDVAELRTHISPDVRVLVVPPGDHAPTFNSLISYALLGNALSGEFHTAYTTLDAPPDAFPADVALLPEATDPTSYGYQADTVSWSGAGLRLYQRDPSVRYHRDFGSGGHYPVVQPGQTLALRIQPKSITLPNESLNASDQSDQDQPGQGYLSVALASFGSTNVTLSGESARETWTLPGGLVELTSSRISLPSSIEFTNDGNMPVYVYWGEIRDQAPADNLVVRDDPFVQVLTEASTSSESVNAALQLHTQRLPEGMQKLTGLVVLSHAANGSNHSQEVGQWVFFPAGGQQLRLEANLVQLTAALFNNEQPAELWGEAQQPGDGDYQLTLLLANNAKIVYGTTLWTWQLYNNAPTNIAADGVAFAPIALPKPVTTLVADTTDGTLRLRGYTLPGREVSPGDEVSVSVVWQSLRQLDHDFAARVTIATVDGHVVAQQTAVLGAPEHGTSTWQEGEMAEQAFKLVLPQALPTTPLTVTVELLDAAGEPLPLGSPPLPLELTTLEVVD